MMWKLAAGLIAIGIVSTPNGMAEEPAQAPVKITRWVPEKTNADHFVSLKKVVPTPDGMTVTDRCKDFPVIYKLDVPPGIQVTGNLGGKFGAKLHLFAMDRSGQLSEGLAQNRARDIAHQSCAFENRTDKPVRVFFAVAWSREMLYPFRTRLARCSGCQPGTVHESLSPTLVATDPKVGAEFQIQFVGAKISEK